MLQKILDIYIYIWKEEMLPIFVCSMMETRIGGSFFAESTFSFWLFSFHFCSWNLYTCGFSSQLSNERTREIGFSKVMALFRIHVSVILLDLLLLFFSSSSFGVCLANAAHDPGYAPPTFILFFIFIFIQVVDIVIKDEILW